MKFVIALAAIPAAALALSACSEAEKPAPEPVAEEPSLTAETVTDAECSADQFQDLAGTMLTDDKLYEIQETNPNTRAYKEGAPAVTAGFDGTRLNLLLDDDRTILDVRCG